MKGNLGTMKFLYIIFAWAIFSSISMINAQTTNTISTSRTAQIIESTLPIEQKASSVSLAKKPRKFNQKTGQKFSRTGKICVYTGFAIGAMIGGFVFVAFVLPALGAGIIFTSLVIMSSAFGR